MKKFICMIISIVMVFTMIPMFGVQVFAAEVVAAKIGDMEFNTLQSAVTYAVNTTSAVTVSLEKNVIENITVASGNCVTLDLNGNVIKGTGISSVIKIEDGANLTIIDSGSNSFVHYYTVNNRGIWTWNDKVTEGAIAFESLSETPSARTVIAVSGGAITGGNGSSYESPISYKCGGGVTVVSGGSLIMQGGNIIGNVAQIGGGIFSFQSVAFSVENIRVAGNYAEDCGGGLSVYDCDTNITNASISFNFAGEKEYLWYEDGFGGGI